MGPQIIVYKFLCLRAVHHYDIQWLQPLLIWWCPLTYSSQTQETEILGNTFGSSRYLDFLRGLGQLLWLPDCPPELIYLGGLDRSGTDGQCTYFYQDEITQGSWTGVLLCA